MPDSPAVNYDDFACPGCKHILDVAFRTQGQKIIPCPTCGEWTVEPGLIILPCYNGPARIVKLHAPQWNKVPPQPQPPGKSQDDSVELNARHVQVFLDSKQAPALLETFLALKAFIEPATGTPCIQCGYRRHIGQKGPFGWGGTLAGTTCPTCGQMLQVSRLQEQFLEAFVNRDACAIALASAKPWLLGAAHPRSQGPDLAACPTISEPTSDRPRTDNGSAGPVRKPSKDDFVIHKYQMESGKTQTEMEKDPILMQLLGRTMNQGNISRAIKRVDKWRGAGNDFPDLTQKPTPVDPERLDLGKNQEGRTQRQRHRRND
jgi:hypothetical protein